METERGRRRQVDSTLLEAAGERLKIVSTMSVGWPPLCPCCLRNELSSLRAAWRRQSVQSTQSDSEQHGGSGYNHVDTAALRARGVVLGYTPDCLTETTADLTVTLLLVTARRIQEAIAAVRSRPPPRPAPPALDPASLQVRSKARGAWVDGDAGRA